MPLPWRKKWNIYYLYQPAFIQQAGIISPEPAGEKLIREFIKLAAIHYRYAAITLNSGNSIRHITGANISSRNNYIIRLNDTLPAFAHKGEYFPKRYRRALKNNLTYVSETNFSFAINLYRKLYGSRLPAFKKRDYDNFAKICKFFAEEKNLIIRKVQHGNETVALVLMLRFKNRLYNMISCILETGKKLLANYFLYGKLLEELSGENQILDLEGSDVAGIKFFYEKMAHENHPYPSISYNHLPKMIRLLKK